MPDDPIRDQVPGDAQRERESDSVFPAQPTPAQPPAPAPGEPVLNINSNEPLESHNAYGDGGWLFSPGRFELFAAGYRALTEIASPEHLRDGRLRRVRLGGYKGDPRVYIWTTHPLDLDGIEIKSLKTQPTINMTRFLRSIKQRRERRLAERFDLVEADADAPHKPALMMVLTKPQGRKYFKTYYPKKKS